MKSITDRVLLIRVNRTYRPGMSDDSLYEATRKWWVLNPDRAPDLAFAIYRGTVRGVFRIDDWEQDAGSGRWAFRGRLDAKLAREYVGRDVSDYFPRGAANPIRYVNC
jgi:hypothetical protein